MSDGRSWRSRFEAFGHQDDLPAGAEASWKMGPEGPEGPRLIHSLNTMVFFYSNAYFNGLGFSLPIGKRKTKQHYSSTVYWSKSRVICFLYHRLEGQPSPPSIIWIMSLAPARLGLRTRILNKPKCQDVP